MRILKGVYTNLHNQHHFYKAAAEQQYFGEITACPSSSELYQFTILSTSWIFSPQTFAIFATQNNKPIC